MLISFDKFEEWKLANKTATRFLEKDPDIFRVHLYLGLASAISEVTQGIAKQVPHKKKVFYIRGTSPLLDQTMMSFSKEGYNVVILNYEQLQDLSWMEQVDREALFVLFGVDDPITGFAHDTFKMEEELASKRVFSIRVSHNRHFSQGLADAPQKHGVHLYAVNRNTSLAFLGDKSRFTPLISSQISWDQEKVKEDLVTLNQVQNFKDEILKFEQSCKDLGTVTLVNQDHGMRSFDRAVLCWEDIDGSAFCELLAERLGLDLSGPGYESRLETASLIRWGGVRTMEWYNHIGMTPNQVRGSVAIAGDLVNSELFEHIKAVREQLLTLQG